MKDNELTKAFWIFWMSVGQLIFAVILGDSLTCGIVIGGFACFIYLVFDVIHYGGVK